LENYLKNFKCIRCSHEYRPDEVQYTCPTCGGNFDARYYYDEIRRVFSPSSLSKNKESSVWRYRAFLPLGLSESPIALRVGMTPLTRSLNLGKHLGLQNLHIKNDGLNPSGSFKDRASFLVVAHCMEKEIHQICAASTGNAGVSLACMAASAQVQTMIFVPETAPRAKLTQLLIYGAKVFAVRGNYSQAFELCEQVSDRLHWYNRNTGTSPYTREGKKTVSFEIWEQMGYQPPDLVVVSVGDGNIISGVYKGFFDLHQAGLLQKLPKIVGVQSLGSASITHAFHGDGVIRKVEANTIADSISVSMPSDGEAALQAVRNTGGTMVAVPDEEILKSMKLLAETEGIFAESSGVTCLAGLKKLVDDGSVDPGQKIVLLVTGNGLKDVENALKVSGTVTSVEPDLDHVLKRLRGH
jgi:threonine synthase